MRQMRPANTALRCSPTRRSLATSSTWSDMPSNFRAPSRQAPAHRRAGRGRSNRTARVHLGTYCREVANCHPLFSRGRQLSFLRGNESSRKMKGVFDESPYHCPSHAVYSHAQRGRFLPPSIKRPVMQVTGLQHHPVQVISAWTRQRLTCSVQSFSNNLMK